MSRGCWRSRGWWRSRSGGNLEVVGVWGRVGYKWWGLGMVGV